ncbi:hypothetical protein HYH03_016824 [Edaphochlamys debaryana]|uniref:Protein kinase domain-containing protein n=1 Tax=Edaphochlamys debaryana TaxID=47281 RepID=A0A835XJ85_9CHLO|nr:hypothetical protein HYH03_016824 [Edaphochlamys debaryana]|eukprot:KAG2484410.1 hypothetical protein HYH03_016824 [Edaphochlamys debaryana]
MASSPAPEELLGLIKKGRSRELKEQLQQGKAGLLQGAAALTPLLRAACLHSALALEVLLADLDPDTASDLASKVDSQGCTFLHTAAYAGNHAALELLLSRASDPLTLVKSKDYGNMTALHYAAWTGATGAACVLLEQGADVHALDKDGMAPLHMACAAGHTHVAALLLHVEAAAAHASSSGSGGGGGSDADPLAPFQRLAGAGMQKCGPLLRTRAGWTPAHLAACAGALGVLRVLQSFRPDCIALPCRAEAGAGEFSGWTPLHCAVACGEAEAVQVLMGMGADPAGPTGFPSPRELATDRATWLEWWHLREDLPRFPTELGREDRLGEQKSAERSFADVSSAFKQGLRSRGEQADVGGVPGAPSAWNYDIPWGSITEVRPVVVTEDVEIYHALYQGTEVALKGVPGDSSRLRKEYALMRYHPPHEHITHLIGMTDDGRGALLVMAWHPLDLQRLFLERAEARRLTLHKKLEIATELAVGLWWLHAHGIVHRDIKPDKLDNVLLNGDLRVKITDFGISQPMTQDGGIRTKQGMGSPLWMAPELIAAHGTKAAYTQEVDVYGWGVIFCQLISSKHDKLYELLAPELITPGTDGVVQYGQLNGLLYSKPETLYQIPAILLRKLPEHLEAMPPAVREAALGLAAECLSVDPSRRPGMDRVAERVRALLTAPWRPTAEEPQLQLPEPPQLPPSPVPQQPQPNVFELSWGMSSASLH